ncbi:MAG TPA: helix-turn-helix domain-containing protein [candidate division Zixibacteria bacterium]|nr:helix-turn-helix domain-containing protein [candidate division Zixibacteria bacterium]
MENNNIQKNCSKESNGFPCFIPAQRVLNLISKKWSIQIIHLLGGEKIYRYNDLREKLQQGWKRDKISDATLSARLSQLVKEGLILREVYPELPPRVEYTLSKKGINLSKALVPLIDWTVSVCHEKL